MACVYRAMDTGSGTVVAVKKVRTEGASLDEAAIRREMDIYGRLRHIASPHILAVLDILREAGEYALVTEYADGGSLWDLLGGDEATDETRKPLDENTVAMIAADVLDGLAALHEQGIVHRDIKPQNILRCDDVWKIADFGISKLMNNPVTGYTFQGAFTAPWAPPEQITGAPAHPSADVYAWARVVGYMLTGRTSAEKTLSVKPTWREILAPCVDFRPENRPTVGKLQTELTRMGR
jgi:serine/threonine protein kinase